MEEALSTEQPGAQTTSPMADRGDGGASTIGDSDSIGGEHPLQDPLEDVSVMEVLAGAGGGEEDTVYGTALDDAGPPPPSSTPSSTPLSTPLLRLDPRSQQSPTASQQSRRARRPLFPRASAPGAIRGMVPRQGWSPRWFACCTCKTQRGAA